VIEPRITRLADEDIMGIEYLAGAQSIAIVAVGRDGGDVVSALDVSTDDDRVVGPWLHAIGWIEPHHAEPGLRVAGVIVAKEATESLKLARARVPGVQLLAYAPSLILTLPRQQPAGRCVNRAPAEQHCSSPSHSASYAPTWQRSSALPGSSLSLMSAIYRALRFQVAWCTAWMPTPPCR
jgi:hypothetical protein